MAKHSSIPWHRLGRARAVAVGCVVIATLTAGALMARGTDDSGRPTAAGTAASPSAVGSGPAGEPSTTLTADEEAKARQALAEQAEQQARAAARAERRAKARAEARAEARAKALAKARARAARNPDPATIRIASFNVLGDSHTARGGDKPGYASGVTRMGMTVEALRSTGIDVVGFQEYEAVQHRAFLNRTGGSWGVYPGTALGNNAVRNSIAWRQDTWTALEQHTIPIPYFRGNRVPMPYVLLEHDATGRRLWVSNVHLPTSNARRGNNERWRDLGTTLQVQLVNRLRSSGVPVVLMGDFNERAEAFCAVTSRTGANAANGGSSSPCRPPANAGIDWMFGTPDITFSDYVRLRSSLIARASDHPLIASTAVLDGPLP